VKRSDSSVTMMSRASDMWFPMYVLPVVEFQSMTEAVPHQTLLARGLLTEVLPDQELVSFFVSHQWCGLRHPDPGFQQLSVLQGALERANGGRLQVDSDIVSTVVFGAKGSFRAGELRGIRRWHMWYDYFSIPQPQAVEAEGADRAELEADLARAVSSLAAYVEMCKLFFVLAPSVQHEAGYTIDYKAWKTRGWCRYERLARVLTANTSVTMLLVKRADTAIEMGAHDFLYDAVGRGDFGMEADRQRLAGPASQLVQARLLALRASGDLATYRRLAAMAMRLLDGLPAPGPRELRQSSLGRDPAEGFLRLMQLTSPTRCVQGTTPLLLATAMGDIEAMQALIRLRASVQCRERRHVPGFHVLAGQPPTHVAAQNGHAAALALLLDAKASVHDRDNFGSYPLHQAAFAERPVEIATLLVERRTDINSRSKIDCSALDMAAMYGRRDAVEYLLAAGAARESGPGGFNPLHFSALFGAGPEVVRTLVQAGVSPHDRFSPRRGSLLWWAHAALGLSYSLGRRSFSTLWARHCWGATPLMVAVMFDDPVAAAVLLENGADVEARNSRGATAESLAEIFGTSTSWLAGARSPKCSGASARSQSPAAVDPELEPEVMFLTDTDMVRCYV